MQLHLVSKEIWNVAMTLYPYLPVWLIDKLVLLMCAVVFGDTAKHGLRRPAIGPFTAKCTTTAYPVVDVGTYAKIRSGEIRVLSHAVKSVHGNLVEFNDGKQYPFDAIVFATGYRSTVRRWLKVRLPINQTDAHLPLYLDMCNAFRLHHGAAAALRAQSIIICTCCTTVPAVGC